MAKAHISLENGTKITVEGTPSEVAALIANFDKGTIAPKPEKKIAARKSTAKPGPIDLVSELIDGGFFKKPKELGAIKTALEEHGHYYPVTTLSPAVLRLVRKRQLRRIKDNKRWLYVE
ncbi:MAG TPA: hypothetical protein VMJ12_10075 [Candidatus Acidoferrales bacterium]|nr:hypothetical protein [Candidatus Acidoferrales bacterium]